MTEYTKEDLTAAANVSLHKWRELLKTNGGHTGSISVYSLCGFCHIATVTGDETACEACPAKPICDDNAEFWTPREGETTPDRLQRKTRIEKNIKWLKEYKRKLK